MHFEELLTRGKRFEVNDLNELHRRISYKVKTALFISLRSTMFGGSNLFQMLNDDFMRDPFFQDPFRSAFNDVGVVDPFHSLTQFPASGFPSLSATSLPHRVGREVSVHTTTLAQYVFTRQVVSLLCGLKVRIDSPRYPSLRPSSVSVEEVQDSGPTQLAAHRPQVQEPDDGMAQLSGLSCCSALCASVALTAQLCPSSEPEHGHVRQPVRQQAPTQSMLDLFSGPFSHPAFAPMFGSEGFAAPNNTFCYTATTFAQQAPDGTQYSQSSSSAYGPTGVRHCLSPH